MRGVSVKTGRTFRLVLIKPSHYDDDGYVIQWVQSATPSNSLAVLYGLALDCAERKTLGDDVRMRITALDETNSRIKPKKIIHEIRNTGMRGMVGLVGVQSNQFPRAMDIARPLRRAGLQVCIGGFHVSGCLAMLPQLPPELQEALDLGISLFAGEAEGRLDEVLEDAHRGELKPIYNFMSDLPSLEGAPLPTLPTPRIKRVVSALTSFDAGRGCPFQCSFCTIINVQGRRSRHRSPDEVAAIVRANVARGIRRFFITDDNFARNKVWEPILDRLIALREVEGVRGKFIIQVDTLCHKLPNFIEKARRAGVMRVFIGLENINPDNLMSAKKRQNKITEYRVMLQAWKDVGVLTYCGYILGFPADTPERIMRDIEIIKRELPVDLIEFFCLTPLPGSEDHRKLLMQGTWMDPDMNKYDLEHVTTTHPLMSAEEWQETYRRAWDAYYTPEHVEVIMRRAAARHISVGNILLLVMWFYGFLTFEGVHPLQSGILRRKYRKDRRSGMPTESPFAFYPRYVRDVAWTYLRASALAWRYNRMRKRVKADPKAHEYMDIALKPAADEDLDELEMFTSGASAKAAVVKARKFEADRIAMVGAKRETPLEAAD